MAIGNDSKFATDQKTVTRSVLEGDKILSKAVWAELRTFLALAKTGSFNKAAELLGTSQPTVSRQVARVQDMFDKELFFSTKVGTKLTEAGMELAKQIAHFDLQLSTAFEDISTNKKPATKDVSGRVRVSATEGLAGLFLAPNLWQITEKYPNIQVLIQNPINITSLRDNLTDMMISYSNSQQDGVTIEELGALHLIPVASKKYIEMYGMPTQDNIHKHRFVQMPFYSSSETLLWEPWCRLVEQGSVSHLAESSFAYAMMVKTGQGIGLLGNYILLDNNYTPLSFNIEIHLRLYGAVLTDRIENRTVKIVFDFLCEIFGKTNPWFAEDSNSSINQSFFDRGLRTFFNIV